MTEKIAVIWLMSILSVIGFSVLILVAAMFVAQIEDIRERRRMKP